MDTPNFEDLEKLADLMESHQRLISSQMERINGLSEMVGALGNAYLVLVSILARQSDELKESMKKEISDLLNQENQENSPTLRNLLLWSSYHMDNPITKLPKGQTHWKSGVFAGKDTAGVANTPPR